MQKTFFKLIAIVAIIATMQTICMEQKTIMLRISLSELSAADIADTSDNSPLSESNEYNNNVFGLPYPRDNSHWLLDKKHNVPFYKVKKVLIKDGEEYRKYNSNDLPQLKNARPDADNNNDELTVLFPKYVHTTLFGKLLSKTETDPLILENCEFAEPTIVKLHLNKFTQRRETLQKREEAAQYIFTASCAILTALIAAKVLGS